jgi:hypothetical protein
MGHEDMNQLPVISEGRFVEPLLVEDSADSSRSLRLAFVFCSIPR